jgi:hypothetical protein
MDWGVGENVQPMGNRKKDAGTETRRAEDKEREMEKGREE